MRLRLLWLFAILLSCAGVSRAQYTAVTAQVTDSAGTNYASCQVSVSFVPSPSATTVPLIGGSTFQTVIPVVQCDSLGRFLVQLVDNNQVSDGHGSPPSSQWQFSICSATGAYPIRYCFTYTAVVTGASENLTSAFTAIAPILPVNIPGPPGPAGPTGPTGAAGTNGAISAIQNNGTPLPVEPYLNMTTGATCMDNSGATSTDCAFSSASSLVKTITDYGARAYSFATTCAISSSSQTMTIGTAGSLQTGDGIVCIGAGATNSLSTPSAPTVTPSAETAPNNTDKGVASKTGSDTEAYKIVSEDPDGGLTAASDATTITNGNTLGVHTTTGCTFTRANNVVTVSNCATDALPDAIVSLGADTDSTFSGHYVYSIRTSDTEFILTPGGEDTRLGGEGSGTSDTGSVTWTDANCVALPNDGAWKYHLYKYDGANYTWEKDSLPNSPSQVVSAVCDYGSPINDHFTRPWYVPATAPASAQNDFLSTKIDSGAGTTTLTVHDAASNTVSGTDMRFDNGPALYAAAVAANTAKMPAYIPTGSFDINSPVTLPNNTTLQFAGGLNINATINLGGGTPHIWGEGLSGGYGAGSFAVNAGPPFTCTVSPCVYQYNGQGTDIRGMSFLSYGNTNGNRLLFFDDIYTFNLYDDVFAIGSGSGYDYTGVGFINRNAYGGGGATARPRLENNSFLFETHAGSAGVLWLGGLPAFWNKTFIPRTIYADSALYMDFTNTYSQNLGDPLLEIEGSCSGGGKVLIHRWENDTSGTPVAANLCGGKFGGPAYENFDIQDVYGATGQVLTTGGFNYINTNFTGLLGQNTGTANCNGSKFGNYATIYPTSGNAGPVVVCTQSFFDARTPLYSSFWVVDPPSAVTASLSAGGSMAGFIGVSVAAQISIVFPNGSSTSLSTASNCVTPTMSDQTIIIGGTVPTNIPAGALLNIWLVECVNGSEFSWTNTVNQALTSLPFTLASLGSVVTEQPPQIATGGYPDIGGAGVWSPQVTTRQFNPGSVCNASGTAANPSVVSCGEATGGIIYCDVAASAGTCTVNTTAITAGSIISILPSKADGTLLTVTCNTALTAVTAPLLAAKVAATSFTIDMPTVMTNGVCYEWFIVNNH